MPDTRKDKLALAFNALNDAKERMDEDEAREMLNRRLQMAGKAKKGIMPTMPEVAEVEPPVYEEGAKAKSQNLPYITRKKSKLYEMMR